MKKDPISNLAFFSNRPMFKKSLHVGYPNIGDEKLFLNYTKKILKTRWLTNNGPYVREFESKIARFVGVKHCIAMCNATVALEIAIRALDLSGEVIVPSFTFVATAHALQWEEIRPVFCDIDPKTYTLDPEKVESLITPHTTGIIGVHLWSRPCDVDALSKIARKRNLKLLFDAAHSFACSYKGQKIGSFGDAEVFSFHATKFFNTFEGGAIVTNNDALAEKLRLMKNFGFAGYDRVVYLGTNGKMSEISAAMGLTGLKSLKKFISANKKNYERYKKYLSGIPGIRLIFYDPKQDCNYQYVVIFVDEEQTGISRDELLKLLMAENVIARRYFYPGCHRMEPYQSFYPGLSFNLPVTEKVCEQVLVLPAGSAMGSEEIQKICNLVRFCVANGRELSRRLKTKSLNG